MEDFLWTFFEKGSLEGEEGSWKGPWREGEKGREFIEVSVVYPSVKCTTLKKEWAHFMIKKSKLLCSTVQKIPT